MQRRDWTVDSFFATRNSWLAQRMCWDRCVNGVPNFLVCTHIHVTHVTYVITHMAFQLTGPLYLAISSLSQVKGLTLQDQFLLVNAPIDAAEPRQRRAFVNFVRHYASGRPVLLSPSVMPPGPPRSEGEMGEAEDLHKARRLLHGGGLVYLRKDTQTLKQQYPAQQRSK